MLRGGRLGAEPATTLWELWDSDQQGPGMNSRNHIMFGTVGSWMYKHLLGVTPLAPGFGSVRVQPSGVLCVGCNLTRSVDDVFVDDQPRHSRIVGADSRDVGAGNRDERERDEHFSGGSISLYHRRDRSEIDCSQSPPSPLSSR